MTVQTRADYEHRMQVLGICVSARIPVLLWGDPGIGKTAVIESAANAGWHVETLIVSHYEPSDFAGLPIVTAGSVDLAPPAWAQRLAGIAGPSIAFFDEFSTASPALQAAALRPLTHYEVGSLALPETVSFVAAANPADVAAAGWELAAPTASRFVHVDWVLPLEVYAECMVTGEWPSMPVYDATSPEYEVALRAERVLVSGFLRARASQMSAVPKDAASRGRAFPTPRTWDYAARLSAFAVSVNAPKQVRRLLVAGCIGEAAAHEFLAWASNQDLPDPEELLADSKKFAFTGLRADRVYVVLQSVLSAVVTRTTPGRWTAAVEICARAAREVGVDPAVPVVRALMRPGLRPATAAMPPDIAIFGSALAMAGLLPGKVA